MKIQTVLATKDVHVVTIHPHQSLKEAAALLTQHNIGAVVVVNDSGAPVGLLSERDIVRAAARQEDSLSLPVRAVMTHDIVTASPEDDVQAVLQSMSDGHFRHMPILDQGALIGMVSILDLVQSQFEECQGEVDTLETLITGE